MTEGWSGPVRRCYARAPMSDTKPKNPEPEHLKWLVDCRSRNQRATLALYELLVTHGAQLGQPGVGGVTSRGYALVSVTFSLWRAVFLADRSGSRQITLQHTTTFLGKLVADNAIGYPQDKESRDWTFMYYLNNARFVLEQMGHKFPDPTSKDKGKEMWEVAEGFLEAEIEAWKKTLQGLPPAKPAPAH